MNNFTGSMRNPGSFPPPRYPSNRDLSNFNNHRPSSREIYNTIDQFLKRESHNTNNSARFVQDCYQYFVNRQRNQAIETRFFRSEENRGPKHRSLRDAFLTMHRSNQDQIIQKLDTARRSHQQRRRQQPISQPPFHQRLLTGRQTQRYSDHNQRFHRGENNFSGPHDNRQFNGFNQMTDREADRTGQKRKREWENDRESGPKRRKLSHHSRLERRDGGNNFHTERPHFDISNILSYRKPTNQKLRMINSALNKVSVLSPKEIHHTLKQMQDADVRPDAVTYNSIINRHCPDLHSACQFLKQMQDADVRPDAVTYTSIINRHCPNLQSAGQFLKQMQEAGVRPDAFTYTTIINRHCPNLQSACQFLKQMQEAGVRPDAFTYNSIINRHCPNLQSACQFLKQMQEAGVRPNAVTYTSIINRHCPNLHSACQFLKQMQEAGVRPDAVTYTTIINRHCPNLQSAGQFLKQMQEAGVRPNAVTYTSIINRHCPNLQSACQFLKQMQDADVRPDAVTYTSIINRHCPNLQSACQFLKQMQDAGVRPDAVTYNSIINRHCPNLQSACQFLKQMQKAGVSPNVVTYNSIINRHCPNLHSAGQFLKQMQEAGVSPDDITYSSILQRFIGQLSVQKLAQFYEKVSKKPRQQKNSVDFHEVLLGTALFFLKAEIIPAVRQGSHFTLIVGQGHHSKNGAVLKPGIMDFLSQFREITISEDQRNAGRLIVLGAPKEGLRTMTGQ